MEYTFKLDECEIDALITEILCKFPNARTLGLNKEKVFDADKYLKIIEQYPNDKKLSGIIYVKKSVIPKTYNSLIKNSNSTIYAFDIIWQYVYVLASLYHYDDSLWRNHFLPRIKELVGSVMQDGY